MKLELSCRSCRRCKNVGRSENMCNYRSGSFNAIWDDRPCENWLPSKNDIRNILLREAALKAVENGGEK